MLAVQTTVSFLAGSLPGASGLQVSCVAHLSSFFFFFYLELQGNPPTNKSRVVWRIELIGQQSWEGILEAFDA